MEDKDITDVPVHSLDVALASLDYRINKLMDEGEFSKASRLADHQYVLERWIYKIKEK